MQDPKLQEAFRKAIKYYFEDGEFSEYDKAIPDRKYNKKYFDEYESELFPSENTETKKQTKGKKNGRK